MGRPEFLVVLAEPDPVARAVGDRLAVGESTGVAVDGAPIRSLSREVAVLRRAGLHIHDERLDVLLPREWRESQIPLVFPSVHRSERGDPALTVHPLGNPGTSAEVGGRPNSLVPSPARLMVDGLRRLAEGAGALGIPATYEATHHGPFLELPAFFIEVGGGDPDRPTQSATNLIADVVASLRPDPSDTVVLGVGGGHYAPHFTDLALRRSLAFGHILPRHVLDDLAPGVARDAWMLSGTPAAGVVYARAADAQRPVASQWGRRFREADAPKRNRLAIPSETDAGARSAGT
ncbi:MAG: D-aminoacyl-tRNA deacylase [Thermoplasmata archaeon]|nr:D-aminoacyl-tRNA deacylase [Thermoplasmata archaeon]